MVKLMSDEEIVTVWDLYPRLLADEFLSRQARVAIRFRDVLREIERFGHSKGHGRGYTCADMAAQALLEADSF